MPDSIRHLEELIWLLGDDRSFVYIPLNDEMGFSLNVESLREVVARAKYAASDDAAS